MPRLFVTVLLSVLIASSASAVVTMDWTPVGNPGNAADTTGYGAVVYAYQIGTYEVTNAQYAEFLNAKAASDPLGLYNTNMASSYGGITRTGSVGSYSYSVIAGRENMPVNYVSFYDALRFANWLNNGQGSGDTERGAYKLLGGTATPSNGTTVTRSAGATIFLTSEHEWYKAAYYSALGTYFDYPAGSDTQTTCSTATATGNRANCGNAVGNVTIKGSYTGSASPYSTFDQGGNVDEWNEAIINIQSLSFRGLRGGSFGDTPDILAAAGRRGATPAIEDSSVGFRVTTHLPVTIDWTPVGNPDNAADNTGYGAVGYAYQIGTYEVTNAQYAEFLNAKAASTTDPLGLYDMNMASSYGGITRTGSAGSYSYSVIGGRGGMPVNYVSFYDALRFVNWLHNGQGIGDTESGAYTLQGSTATPSNGTTVTRNPGATVFLPSEDEWYKAAYYSALGTYFDYPAGSDTQTTCSTATATANRANCGNAVGNVTIKGSYTGSASPYGTFDQGGNVWEWNEAIIFGSDRVIRGGSFGDSPDGLAVSARSNNNPAGQDEIRGFRVATLPEPITVVGLVAGIGAVALLTHRRRLRD